VNVDAALARLRGLHLGAAGVVHRVQLEVIAIADANGREIRL
jgi:hypothetical protein